MVQVGLEGISFLEDWLVHMTFFYWDLFYWDLLGTKAICVHGGEMFFRLHSVMWKHTSSAAGDNT